MQNPLIAKLSVPFLFLFAFLAGNFAGFITDPAYDGIFAEVWSDTASDDSGNSMMSVNSSDSGNSSDSICSVDSDSSTASGSSVTSGSSAASAQILLSEADNWGLSFQEEGKRPVGNATIEELAQYDAWYAADTEEKVIYLTFDCGYENGNLPTILDALKKHDVSATFFVVGTFLEAAPELAKRMAEEGHTVGNHTWHHPDMSAISTIDAFAEELNSTAELYEEITGKEMSHYYRPPQGKYSTENLQMAQELGYTTIFWSLAYVDWYQDDQPTKEEAFEKLLGRIHPGAIVLLHSTSSTNASILDELLTRWEEMGYRFGTLQELTG